MITVPSSTSETTVVFIMPTATAASTEMSFVVLSSLVVVLVVVEPSVVTVVIFSMGSVPETDEVCTLVSTDDTSSKAAACIFLFSPISAATFMSARFKVNAAPTPTDVPSLTGVLSVLGLTGSLSSGGATGVEVSSSVGVVLSLFAS